MDRNAQLEKRYMELHEDFKLSRSYDGSVVREDVLELRMTLIGESVTTMLCELVRDMVSFGEIFSGL